MRKLASVRQIKDIRPIAGADRIELAIVGGWKCVVKKNDFAIDDLIVYCEIDSFLPIRDEFEFLRSSSFKKMGEQEGFRLRTVKLRGQLSQGLLLPLSVLGAPADEAQVGDDVTEILGIQKYEAPIPTCLTGQVVGMFPGSISKTDEERIQNLASDFDSFKGKPFFVSEKIDGTSFTAFFDEDFGVCGRNLQYIETPGNSYWRIANQLNLKDKLTSLERRIAIQGELVGPGIQSNRYKLKDLTLFVFNVFDLDSFGYLDKSVAAELCDQLGLQMVPHLEPRAVPDSLDEILNLAEGKSVLNEQTEREGLVWVHGSGRERISFKTISNKFLSRVES